MYKLPSHALVRCMRRTMSPSSFRNWPSGLGPNTLRCLHDHRARPLHFSTSQVQDVRKTVSAFLARLNGPYEAVPFDDALYQECLDEAARRGYATDGTPSAGTYLREGVTYVAATCGHLTHRPTQVWAALYAGCSLAIDDTMARFPLERAHVYRFQERFLRGEAHGSGVLDPMADLLRRAPDVFGPVASGLVVASTLNSIAGNILEHESEGVQISSVERRYAAYQRLMGAAPEAFVCLAFPREISVRDYAQALPEMMLFFVNANDILSFYKEELSGETSNQISMMAARNETSKLDELNTLAETTAHIFENAVEILRSPEACESFKKFANGFVRFHLSVGRYRLADLGLQ